MNARLFRYASAGAMLALSLGSALPTRAAPAAPMAITTTVVKPSAMAGWMFYNDENDTIDPTLGSFVTGPGTPVAGYGSAQISVLGTQRRNLATYQFSGVPLSTITTLKYRTYNPSIGNGGAASRTAYLNFNVDFLVNDTWQRRLIFLPNDNGGVTPDNWKEFDGINGGAAMWRYSGATWPLPMPGSVAGSAPQSWATILSTYPGVRIRVTDAFVGLRVGEPYASGYTENIDTFTFGTAANTTIFDFEPATVVVRPGATLGWGILPTGAVAVTTNNATGMVVSGPGGQAGGLLPGSVEYKTNSASGGKPQLFAPANLTGVKFTDLTKLDYSTYIAQYAAGGPHLTHAVNVKIDLDGSLGTTSDQYTMVYEPCYSTSCAGAVQPLNTWATWNAIGPTAIWWSTGAIAGTAFVNPFNSFAPLTTIYATYPNAVIAWAEFQAGQGSGGMPWNDFIGNLDGVTFGIAGNDTTFDFEPSGLTINPSATLVGVGQSFPLDLVANGVGDLYGYQFQLNYDSAKLTAAGVFVNTFFDTTSNALVGWNATCAAGVCKYAASKNLPVVAGYSGTGALGRVNFTAVAPGVVTLNYTLVQLRNSSASLIPIGTQTAVVTIYGTGTINGVVNLQGRPSPITPGVIYATDTSGTFAPVQGTFNSAGNYSINVPALAGGSTWRIIADHTLYLANQTSGAPLTDVTVAAGGTATASTTMLRAGDANNDETVSISDFSCIGFDFGGPGNVCNTTGNSDINADGIVDIFDLVLTGINYNKVSPQPWQ